MGTNRKGDKNDSTHFTCVGCQCRVLGRPGRNRLCSRCRVLGGRRRFGESVTMTEAEWLTCKDPLDMLRALNLLHYPSSPALSKLEPLISPRQAWLIFFAMDRQDLTFAPQTDDPEELETRRLILSKCEAGERYADGLCTAEDVWQARHPDRPIPEGAAPEPYASLRQNVYSPGEWLPGAAEGVCDLFREIVGNPFRPYLCCRCARGPAYLAHNPDCGQLTFACAACRPGKFSPPPPPVPSLAQAAYLDRQGDGTLDPLTLLALADALEEAGCVGEKCPACDGMGVITQEHPWGDTWAAERFTCPDCEGRLGRVPHPILSHLRGDGPHARGCWAVDLILGKS